MTGERWQRLNDLFHLAVDKNEREREAFLGEACAGDEELLRELRRLLASHRRAMTAFDDSIVSNVVRGLALPDPLPVEGRRFGAYRAVSELGQGGMGTVFLAERADRQYEKRVAIKLVRRGWHTDALVRHFHNERRILASLDHPHIARLLDAGTTDDGLPYFVMEHVDGQPIDDYCDAQRHTLAQRLELFRRVCAAVSHAHRHLVVHRDIKPSNILVTADGTPKLLDFGIARVLDAEPDGDASSPPTVTGLMTPDYASPEQVRGLPLTTLTDVYSLGVVLCELLTGSRPLADRRPSAAVDAGAAARRRTTPERLRRSLRGDLDNIVLMALREEPQRRYRSVDELSEDIRRHMDARPVAARTDALSYRAAKFVRRHRAGVAAAALAGAALVAGIAAATWQAHRATAQESIARAEQAKAERHFRQVRQLARTLLFDYHDAIRDLPGATPVRERMVRDSLAYLDGLAAGAAGDESLQREAASGYERMSDVQGGTLYANLGDTSGAIASVRKALRIRLALPPEAARGRDARRELAAGYDRLGGLLWETGDMDGAVANVTHALTTRRQLVAEAPGDDGTRRDLGFTHDKLGMILLEVGDAIGSLAHHQTFLLLVATLPASEQTRRMTSVGHEHTGSALLEMGDLPGALASNGRALELRAALVNEFPLNADYRRTLLVSHYNQGEILAKLGRTQEALDSYREDLRMAEELSAADPRNEQYRGDMAYALIRVGDMLVQDGDVRAALTHYLRSQAMRAADVKADPTNLWKRSSLIESLAKMCKALAGAEDRAAAIARCGEAAELLQATEVDPTNAAIRGFFAATYSDLGAAHSTLASARATHDDHRRRHWRTARDLFARSAAVWQDLSSRGILSKLDADKADGTAREIARCDTALARLER